MLGQVREHVAIGPGLEQRLEIAAVHRALPRHERRSATKRK